MYMIYTYIYIFADIYVYVCIQCWLFSLGIFTLLKIKRLKVQFNFQKKLILGKMLSFAEHHTARG